MQQLLCLLIIQQLKQDCFYTVYLTNECIGLHNSTVSTEHKKRTIEW